MSNDDNEEEAYSEDAVRTDDDYKKGDVLENRVRIVSVDRKKKRITASLQSDKRRADEEKSAKEHDFRVEQKTDYEKLVFNIKTDGSIHPKEALKEAAKILIHHFMLFSDEKININLFCLDLLLYEF